MGLQSLPSPGVGTCVVLELFFSRQQNPALGRIFITYMICPGFGLVICEKTCPGFGLSFGFHGVHPYQKNICSPPPPRHTRQIRTHTHKLIYLFYFILFYFILFIHSFIHSFIYLFIYIICLSCCVYVCEHAVVLRVCV